jgi:hypothetical protein
VLRQSSEAEASELRMLVDAVGAAREWSDSQFELALTTAMADPDLALPWFRAAFSRAVST